MLEFRQRGNVTQLVAIEEGAEADEMPDLTVLATLRREDTSGKCVYVYAGESEKDLLCAVSAGESEHRMMELICSRLASHCRMVLGLLLLDSYPSSASAV